MQRRFFSCREISIYLGKSEKTIRRLIDKKEIAATRCGRSVLIDLKALNEKLEKGQVND